MLNVCVAPPILASKKETVDTQWVRYLVGMLIDVHIESVIV